MPDTEDIYGGAPALASPSHDGWQAYNENIKKPNPVMAEWDDLEAARIRLFETGSEFKPAARDQIVGIERVLGEIDTLVHWLRHSGAYLEFDARPEPGVLFEGDPGTGKTLCSRYIATASDAFFVNVRDWPHKGTLYSDSDIRELFKAARAFYARTRRPVLLFWDEFENAACERGNASPDQVATVSQLTAELDGIHGKNEGLLLVGCTNYIYGIDQALRRSGRMGLHIEFHAPNRAGKKVILEHYLGLKTTEGEIDTDTLTYFFDPSATAADIEESCEEAWRLAVRRALETGAHPALAQGDLVAVFIKRLVGPPMTFMDLSEDARYRIAIHEVGHAVMSVVYGIPLRLITVQPGKKSLGRTMHSELEDHVATAEEMTNHIRIALGSIAAETVCEVPAMTGSMGDIAMANEMAAKLVDRLYEGAETGVFNPVAVAGVRASRHADANPNVSELIIERADSDIDRVLRKARVDTNRVMALIGSERLRTIASNVNLNVTLTGQEFKAVFAAALGHSDFQRLRA